MANSAQQMKARAAAARAANSAAIKIQHDAAIVRMTALVIAAADLGKEKLSLPSSDQDYELWATPAGREYIISKGFTVDDINYSSGRVLEISWANPSDVP